MPVVALQFFREGDILDLVPLPVPALAAQLHSKLLSLKKSPMGSLVRVYNVS